MEHCNGNPETTVLAHLNGAGMGLKRPDIHGAWACSDCHDVLDRRQQSMYPLDLLKLFHLEGVIRTQEILLQEGKIRYD